MQCCYWGENALEFGVFMYSSDIESNEGGFESRSENDNEGVGFEDSEEERVTGVNDGFDGEDEDLVNLILEKK